MYMHTLPISWHGVPLLNNCASTTIKRVWKFKKNKITLIYIRTHGLFQFI
jgi:hypothetical protein